MQVNPKKLNPLGYHLMKLMQDKSIRHIILYGGSSSGKTYSVAQMVLIFTLWEGTSHIVMRKVGASIKDSIYQDFVTAASQLGISKMFKFSDAVKTIKCLTNGARIVFKGLDDSEKIKGLSSFKRVVMDEWSEFDEEDFKQIRLRLRGMEGQQLIYTFNPIRETHWIKKNVFDRQEWHDISMEIELGGKPVPKELTVVKSMKMNSSREIMNKRTGEMELHDPDTVVIQTTYLNNFWVIGSPDGKYGYYDEQCIATFEFDRLNDPDYYNVYALGEWGVIRTGSEFFGSFNRGKHCAEVKYNPSLPIHISVDSNVLPYITCTYWQIDIAEKTTIYQLDETLATSPNNTVRKAAKLVANRLRELAPQKVYIHGDASTRASNNIDDQKRSFLDLFIDTLNKEGIEVEDKVSTKNPSVPMSGEFINAIFDSMLPGYEIVIGEQCNTSIEDYLAVQKDVNGAILKTKVKNKTTMQTYEEHGHISDTFRYIVTDLLRDEFLRFSNRRKRNLYAKDGTIHFFNPQATYEYSRDIVYVQPNINGKYVMVHGKMLGDRWHIVNVAFRETTSTDEIRQSVMAEQGAQTIVECATAYLRFVRELRKELSGVRVLTEATDIDRRIAATSDFVREHVLFSDSKLNEDAEYALFMSNLLDYNKDSDCKEASAVLSGFVKFVAKFDFRGESTATS